MKWQWCTNGSHGRVIRTCVTTEDEDSSAVSGATKQIEVAEECRRLRHSLIARFQIWLICGIRESSSKVTAAHLHLDRREAGETIRRGGPGILMTGTLRILATTVVCPGAGGRGRGRVQSGQKVSERVWLCNHLSPHSQTTGSVSVWRGEGTARTEYPEIKIRMEPCYPHIDPARWSWDGTMSPYPSNRLEENPREQ